MSLKWEPFVEDSRDGGPVAVAMLAEHDADGTKSTDWELHCDRHWGTGAPDEWIASCAPKKVTVSFPTKDEAMRYAEVTFTLGEANEAGMEGT